MRSNALRKINAKVLAIKWDRYWGYRMSLMCSVVKEKKNREKRIARTDSILKRQNTTTIKLLFLCEFVTDQASKPTTFL